MDGFTDRLEDLSWLGKDYTDQGWFEVGDEPIPTLTADEVEETITKRLRDTAWAVAADNVDMTKGERAAWLEYRQALREIPEQSGFPSNVIWPSEPE